LKKRRRESFYLGINFFPGKKFSWGMSISVRHAMICRTVMHTYRLTHISLTRTAVAAVVVVAIAAAAAATTVLLGPSYFFKPTTF